jgi:hypothetical protein
VVRHSESTPPTTAASIRPASIIRHADAKTLPLDEQADETETAGEGAAAARAKETKGPLRISFEFKDANAATQIRIDGENSYDYKYIVMPLRI